MKIFNHVQIKVRDLKTSRRFYDAIMSVLGYPVVLDLDTVVGYGTSVHDMFEIHQFDEKFHLSQSVHLAFNASSIERVNAFYLVGLKNGAKCNGKPGFRPEYEEGYYSAFLIELDGHNIEAVYTEKNKPHTV
jgi:predicted lactoylglutathione lyase